MYIIYVYISNENTEIISLRLLKNSLRLYIYIYIYLYTHITKRFIICVLAKSNNT